MQLDRDIWDNLMNNTKIIGKEKCIFCNYPNKKEDEKLVINKTKYWLIILNKFPYGGIKNHILVFPKRHVEFSKDLNNQELIDLKNVHNYLYKYYKGEKYFSFLRETFEGRSIKHLHYHYMPGNIYSNEFAEILNKQGY